MSPRWGEVAGYALYFYYSERHQRPHVDARRRSGHRDRATLDALTGEVLRGKLPHGDLQKVRELLANNREQVLKAFYDALEGRRPQKLGDDESEENR